MFTELLLAALMLAVPNRAADSVAAAADLSPRADYLTLQERVDAEYRAARQRCNAQDGHAKDVCLAEAKAKQRIVRADAEARVKNTPRARYDARVARAEAEYQVAKERCGDRAGDAKDACLQQAQAVEERAKTDAHAEWRAAEARGQN